MKVAFLSFGFGEYCVRLTSALSHEADTLLLLPDREAEPYLYMLSDNVKLQSFHHPRLRELLRQIRMVAQLLRNIGRFNPDVVHLQGGQLWVNFALPLLRRYPVVITVHDPIRHVGHGQWWKTPQWVVDFGCHQAVQLIVHVPQMKDLLVKRLHVATSQVQVIPHIRCGDDSAQSHEEEEDNLILFIGWIWEYKGLEYLIRAEPLITALVPKARIIIAGTGEKFGRYERMMVNPDRFIVYNEYVSDEKRAELFRRASVVVLPYIEASQSGVIPMAYSFEKPVVATMVGGLPAQVDDGKTGYLVPPRDERVLADAIVRLLRNPSLRRLFGANGKRKNTVEWSPDVVARETLAVYQLAVNARRQGRAT
jgi:glycosyltransferase involved in cell wall biosynthesis